jgi:anti-anti-sigma factor
MSEAIVVSHRAARCAATPGGSAFVRGSALTDAGAPTAFTAAVEELANGDLVVVARGELDLATRDQLCRALDDARSRGRLAEIDLTALMFMDVTAVQVVLDASEEIGSAAPATIIRVGRIAARLLRLAHVDHRLVLRPPLNEESGEEA